MAALPLLSYLARIASKIVGAPRTLRWLLDFTWAVRRIAWEQAGIVYGERFHNEAMGLSEDTLKEVLHGDSIVLDVGCGAGRWSRVAARYAKLVVGVDHDPSAITKARALTAAPNVEYAALAAGRTLEGLGKFDVSLAIHVLEHLDTPVEVLRTLSSMSRILVVEVPDFEAEPLNLIRIWVGAPFYSDADHVREYTPDLLREHLTLGGWTVDRLERKGGVILATAHV